MNAPLVDWASETWGQPGSNVHVGAWVPDGHDATEGQQS